jgi:hypothetical protein
VAGTAAFWQRHFQFTPAFQSDWYVHLTSKVAPTANLAILDYRHDSLPAPFQRKVAGLVTLWDEPFGQRHFITEGPNGVAIDVIKPIQATAQYAAQFTVPEPAR